MAILGRPITLGGMSSGGKMLFGVTLPKSIYYEQAAEWLKIKDNPKTAVAEANWDGQVVCGGHLWELYGNKAYCYSLENGELLETVPLTGIGNYNSLAITTDGVSRIWIGRLGFSPGVSQSSSGYYAYVMVSFYLYEFDTGTNSVKELYSISLGKQYNYLVASASTYSCSFRSFSASSCRIGIIGYSAQSNKIYFGKNYFTSTLHYNYKESSGGTSVTYRATPTGVGSAMFAYDLTTNTCTQIAAHPYNDAYTGQYFYDDGDFFYVGNGYNGADKDKRISRYNKQSNIWEKLSTTFEGYTVGPFSYVQIGDKMLQISRTATGVFDPKTGNLENLSVPVIPPDNMVIYPGFKAFSNNILYLVTNQGVYKCPFFSEVPEDAPIVCKIYKGQKYHTLEPFSIPNKVNFLRTQQTATEDIEIKMYEYDSAGGQTIYIEDTGRG